MAKEKSFEEYMRQYKRRISKGRNVKNDFAGFEKRGSSKVPLTKKPRTGSPSVKEAIRRRKNETTYI